MRQFVAVLHQALQLGRGLDGGNDSADQLQLIRHLCPQRQLGIQRVGEAKRITLVGFEHARRALLDVNTVDGDIEFQQVLFQQPVIMPGVFQQYLDLLKRHILLESVHEAAEAFA